MEQTKLFDLKPLKPNKVELCREDRIDYKILMKGTSSVTDSELISVLLGEQVPEQSRRLLSSSSNNLNELGKFNYYDLRKFGISHMKAICIMATIELGRRRKLTEPIDRPQIKSSKDAFDILAPVLSDLQHEEFWVLLLNRSNRVIDTLKISQGGISGTVTDVRVVLKKAIEHLASGLIAAHNHPSGNTSPSESDTKITQRLKEAGTLMDIQLLDHIIISNKEYYSLADNGLL
jgi:DNA repair protein RadC